jgi:GT2 family glycosyltransferase
VASLSILVVTFNSAPDVRANFGALLAELGDGDELVVVDNASADGTADAVAELAPEATVLRNDENTGFAAAMNLAAAEARGDLLVLLNPDSRVAPGFGAAIRSPLAARPQWRAWQALVTQAGGSEVNTSGNEVHFTGVSWAGGHGAPVGSVPAAGGEVGFASGACLAIRRTDWLRAGGFPAEYFMYCEDLDLSLRLRLRGGAVGLEPSARVEHDYEFMASPAKWRHLERNRWATILRTYPASLLVLVAPALAGTELAITAAAFAGGWGPQKIASWGDVVRALPRLLRERRGIQAARTVSASEFARGFTASLSSPYLGRAAQLGPLDAALRAYWRMVLAALALGGRLRSGR